MPILVPKIVWPSAGANELLFAFPPVGVRPFDRAGRRHDTIASSGKRQSLLERTDRFLELDITLVPTEAEQYLTRSEELDHADWTKGGAQPPVITADQAANPLDGAVNADQAVFPATGAGQYGTLLQSSIPLPDFGSRAVNGSFWLRAASLIVGRFSLLIGTNIGNESLGLFDIEIGWKRVSFTRTLEPAATSVFFQLTRDQNDIARTIFVWGAQFSYAPLGPYVKTQGVIPAAIDRWDAFITAVLDGTNFDYYPDAFAAGFTTYVLEDKAWRPKLQIRGANRFYEFKLRLREFV